MFDKNHNNKFDIFEEFVTSAIENSNFDCFAFLSDYKSIKINMSDISKLTYNSMITQYNNWLTNIKTDFDEDSTNFLLIIKKSF